MTIPAEQTPMSPKHRRVGGVCVCSRGMGSVGADARAHGFRDAMRHGDEPLGDYGRTASGV